MTVGLRAGSGDTTEAHVSEDVIRIIVISVLVGLTSAIVVALKIKGAQKKLQKELAARGWHHQPGDAALPVPPTALVPKRAKGASWSAQVPPEPGEPLPLGLYAQRGGFVIACWPTRAPGDLELALYQKPSTGNWFHKHLIELAGENRPTELPPHLEVYATSPEAAAQLFADGRVLAAFDRHLAASGKKKWCFQLTGGAGYLFTYDQGAPDLQRLVAGARDLEAALG